MLKQKKSSHIDHHEITDSIQSIDKRDWDGVVDARNIYLSYDYLLALEIVMKKEMDFYYNISYDSAGTPVLIVAMQLVKFIDKRKVHAESLGKLSNHLHKKIADAFTTNVLVCGNVFSDGENGFLWSENLGREEAINEVCSIIDQLKEDTRIKTKSSITLFKEFWPASKKYSDLLKEHSYRKFMIDVNMVLDIPESWKAMDDYFGSMKTKFRTRAKRVFKQSKDIQIKTLTAAEIVDNKERISVLFGNVINKSDFSVGRLDTAVFELFKLHLQDVFSFRAFYLGDEMVGFSTSFLNGDILEANYVGLDYKYNNELAVYQRILYDYVEQSLKSKSRELHLGRTAELIKSSIGALPKNMTLYAKHRGSVRNMLLKPIIESISPREFELRKPFKTN
ncbi:MAG: hypothetical protein P8N52_03925 [Crocinitomicaceae bacterium]|nr:hypothetical protein [Crocinitomicaceae bacterium]MDG1777240.1 hypothetical protein [Crocinitomicaceae bacterium]